jgi:pimeloyl-ACP methyl ester carboxylesterase
MRMFLRVPLVVAMLGLALLGSARGDDPPRPAEQTWEGVLKVGAGAELRLVFHVKEGKDGLSATMDSPDQGASGMKVDSVSRDKTKLTFELKAIQGKFEGKLNAAGTEAVGTWSQGPSSLPLTLKLLDKPIAVPKIVGKEELWEGKLEVGAGMKVRLVLRVAKTEKGEYVAKLDSPDEGLKGLTIDPITIDKSKLAFELKISAAKFEGKLSADGNEAVGNWIQRGATIPLTFKKVDKPSAQLRPQTPKPPFPYLAEHVSYPNKTGGVTLAGTLTEPESKGPFPAVILISGSGAQDRDETLFGHKPFLVIADALTRRGVAVLRVDDRGVGGSTGSTSKSTSEDFAGDVLAGIALLKSRPEIDGKAIGLIGHSEGGIIAPIVAARSDDVAFIVLLAGTGLTGEEILYLQGQLILKAMGATPKALDRQRDMQKRIFEVIKTETDPEKAMAKMRQVASDATSQLPEDERKKIVENQALLDAHLKMAQSPWFRFFLTYDPRPILTKVKCPVLALDGEKDLQVPPRENLDAIAKALKDGGNSRVTTRTLPGLNHLFQTCKTGAPAEYAEIEQTIAPLALTTIADWVVEQAKRR